MTITLKEAQRRTVRKQRITQSNGTGREYSQSARNPLAAALALVKARDAGTPQSARITNAADDLEAMRAEQTDWH
jgi:hypothetical protein